MRPIDDVRFLARSAESSHCAARPITVTRWADAIAGSRPLRSFSSLALMSDNSRGKRLSQVNDNETPEFGKKDIADAELHIEAGF
jgi:hypothetical protein